MKVTDQSTPSFQQHDKYKKRIGNTINKSNKKIQALNASLGFPKMINTSKLTSSLRGKGITALRANTSMHKSVRSDIDDLDDECDFSRGNSSDGLNKTNYSEEFTKYIVNGRYYMDSLKYYFNQSKKDNFCQ